MAIQFVGRNTVTKAGSTGSVYNNVSLSSLSGGIRSSVQNGDFVIGVFSSGSSADRTLTIRDPSSVAYTLIGSELYSNSTNDTNLRVAYKFMGSSPDANTQFSPTNNAADAGATAVYVFSGVDKTTPLDVSATTSTSATSLLVDPAAITPSTAGSFIVVIGAAAHTGGTDTFSASDLTGFVSVGSSDTYCTTLGIGHKNDWTSGEFNPGAWTCTEADSTNHSYASMTIALRPAGAGGKIKVWNGSSWVAKPIKVWNGSTWVQKPLKRWNGSAWVTTPY